MGWAGRESFSRTLERRLRPLSASAAGRRPWTGQSSVRDAFDMYVLFPHEDEMAFPAISSHIHAFYRLF